MTKALGTQGALAPRPPGNNSRNATPAVHQQLGATAWRMRRAAVRLTGLLALAVPLWHPAGHAVAQTPQAAARKVPSGSLVITQGDRQFEVPPSGTTPYVIPLKAAPFTIDLPAAAPGGKVRSLDASPIRVCLSRDPTVYAGASPGRHLGTTPCFNGAAQMARGAEGPDAVDLMLGGGSAHSSFDDQNTEVRRDVHRLNVRGLVEWPEAGVRCTKSGLSDCEALTVERAVNGGEVKVVVWTDLNADRVLNSNEVWPLDIRFEGQPTRPMAADHPLVRVDGRVLTLSDAAEEHRRALAAGRYLNLAQSTVAAVEHALWAQEAARLGLDAAAGASAEAGSDDPAVRRQGRDKGMQIFLEHLGRQTPVPAEAALREFYDQSPSLFAKRKIYQCEMLVPEPGQLHGAGLSMLLKEANGATALAELLIRAGVRFERAQRSLAAENVPLQLLSALDRASPQEGVVITEGARQGVAFVRARQLQPVTFETARPAIERFLANQANMRARKAAMERLVLASRIEWLPPAR